MGAESDPTLFHDCERAFLTEVARSVDSVVSRVAGLSESEKEKLTSSLVFSVASHLSGSSFGGRVSGEEVYPKLGFYHGEGSNALCTGVGSGLHEIVPDVLARLRKQN